MPDPTYVYILYIFCHSKQVSCAIPVQIFLRWSQTQTMRYLHWPVRWTHISRYCMDFSCLWMTHDQLKTVNSETSSALDGQILYVDTHQRKFINQSNTNTKKPKTLSLNCNTLISSVHCFNLSGSNMMSSLNWHQCCLMLVYGTWNMQAR